MPLMLATKLNAQGTILASARAMRVVLADLSSFSGRIELPAKEPRTPYLDVMQVVRLRGELQQRPEHIELDSASADLLELKDALLLFGKVVVRAVARLAMRHVTGAFKSDAGVFALRMQAELGECGELRLEVGKVAVAGAVTLQGLVVAQEDSAGSLVAANLRIENLTVAWGDVALRAPQLLVDDLHVGWGAPAFTLEARRLRAEELELVIEGGSARAASFECEGLHVRGGAVQLAALRASSIQGELLGAADQPGVGKRDPEVASQRPAAASRASLVDWRLLDGLTGRLDADTHVDATFAIVRRRARHKLRAEVQAGCIDFRALERGLSALEDSLLDFSVRQDQLVLELGVPLLPTRGHGKPLVTWPLSSEDEQRAVQGLARLSVLSQPNLPAKSEPSEQGSGSAAVQLHALDVVDIDFELGLTPARSFEAAALRLLGFERLSIKGQLHHHLEDDDDAGRLTLAAESLQLALAQLPIGAKTLALGLLQIGSISEASAEMRGLSPVRATVRVENVALEDLKFGAS